MRLVPVNPESLPGPGRGRSHGVKGSGGDWLFVGGQLGRNREGRLVSDDLMEQFGQALENVLDVVWAAGGNAASLARLTLYVIDGQEYLKRREALETAVRKRLGRHCPAVTLLEVKSLCEEHAKIKIEAVALV